MDYLKLTRDVSREIIQMLAFQDEVIRRFKERLERQCQDLKIAERVTTDGLPDELERVERQRSKLEATKKALRTVGVSFQSAPTRSLPPALNDSVSLTMTAENLFR